MTKLSHLSNPIHVLSNLKRTSRAISRALERLGTGSRLAGPSDDSVSYALDLRLDSQVRGLRQGIQNINSAKGLAATADSAISAQLEIIEQMRLVALQASSDSITSAERDTLNQEVQKLLQEYRRIVTDTQWNGSSILDGSFGTQSLQVSTTSGNEIDIFGVNTASGDVFEKIVGTGLFNAARTYASGATPLDASALDLNNDGQLDIAYLDSTTDVIMVHLGNGDGTLQERKTYKQDSSSSYTNLAYGDINNDGAIDLVTDGGAYLNNGDGSFTLSTTGILGSIQDEQLRDLNNDGKLDIVLQSGAAGSIYYQLGNGDGTFDVITTIAATEGIIYSQAELGDFNNDGLVDIVFGTGAATAAAVFLNTGSSFAEKNFSVLDNLLEFEIGDLNGDGFNDILLTTTIVNQGPEVWLNDGDGNFTFFQTLGGSSTNFSISDVNNDQILDYVNTGSAKDLDVRLGLGNGAFAAAMTQVLFEATSNADLADLNGDGVVDLYGVSHDNDQLGIHLAQTRWISAEADLDASTQQNASHLLKILDQAVDNLKRKQGKISALHSRLDYLSASQLLLSETIDESRFRIRDLDYALEIAELTKNQILRESQIAVAAQANLQMSIVLKLLT